MTLRQLLQPSSDRPAATALLELTQCFGPAAEVLERAVAANRERVAEEAGV